jgi:hypothetical protein
LSWETIQAIQGYSSVALLAGGRDQGVAVGDKVGGSEEVAMPHEMGGAAGEDVAADIDVNANSMANSRSIQGVNLNAEAQGRSSQPRTWPN